MRKYRLVYGGLFLCILGLAFWTGSRFLAVLSVGWLLFPGLLYGLLLLDRNRIGTTIQMRPGAMVGQESRMTVTAEKSGLVLAAGMAVYHLEFHNAMFGETAAEVLKIPLPERENSRVLSFCPELCGELQFEWRSAFCCDMFGIMAAVIGRPEKTRFLVYPKHVDLTLIPGRLSQGFPEGERYRQNRKGNDSSEIFELREYTPGDDVRSIHWKLSEKLDTLIKRESSEPSGYSTVVLFDAGRMDGDRELPVRLLSAAVELGAAVSEGLIYHGIPHYMGVPAGGGLHLMEIPDQAAHGRMLEEWMGLRMTEQAGMGCKYFQAYQLEHNFTKILYITADTYPETIGKMLGGRDVTVICVTGDGDQVKAAENGGCQFMEIPVELLHKQKFQITI